VRASEIQTLDTNEEGVSVSLLASKLGNNVLESYRIILAENSIIRPKSGSPEKNGERFLLIISGSIEAELSEGTYTLNEGDSLNFKSYLSCVIRNTGDNKSEFILNGTPPVL